MSSPRPPVSGDAAGLDSAGLDIPLPISRHPAGAKIAAAQRYSRFVSLMRWALPAAAAVLLVLLFGWPSLTSDLKDLPATTMGQREMTNLRYSGMNAKGEPMRVTAARAFQVGEVADSVDLETVSARLDRQGGGWVTLAAQTGRYEQKANRVILTGQVHLKDDQGYDVVTEKAEINLTEPAQAFGDQPVKGVGPKGTINANGFRITDDGKTVMMTGRASLTVPAQSVPERARP